MTNAHCIRISMLMYYLTKGGIYEWRKELLETTADDIASIWKLKPISAGLQYYLENV